MRNPTLRAWYELLSSMRFAVSLLTVLAIASVIGTVVKQHEPFNNYLNQFGPFWFPIFESLGLYGVYNAGWFLLILLFLLASTGLCIFRQAPQMLREMKSYRTHAREASLKQFAHQAVFQSALDASEIATRARAYLTAQGFRLKEDARAGARLIAAKAGSANRAGYLLAHGGIVVILIGGLLDGNLPLQLKMALEDKQPTTFAALREAVPPQARLDQATLSFRGNLFVPEGERSSLATLNIGDGVLVQDLPFYLQLKKFSIEHYSTGAPKRFASEVVITDKATGKTSEHTIEVNHPLKVGGLTLYQSSFDDGGSTLELRPLRFDAGSDMASLSATVGGSQPFADQTLEITGFRAFNIENMAETAATSQTALHTLQSTLGSAARPADKKEFVNVGPNFQFKLRDAAGQAREYQNYMLPITQEGRAFMMSGVRSSPNENFRYLRMPIDEDGRIETFFALHRVLLDKNTHGEIARRFAKTSLPAADKNDTTLIRLAETAERTLGLYAEQGFTAVGKFIETNVPADEREKAADVFVKILQGCGWEAWRLLREQDRLPALELNDTRAQFVRDTLWAGSDAFHYGSPLYLQLSGFSEVRASVFQVTRSPGEPWVFLGSLLLVAGVYFMLFVRERRAFVLIKDSGEVLFAMSANRKTLEFENAFQTHRDALRQSL
jgi:cytochrome c biogenesis protein